MLKVIIIGGGIAGLACARALEQKGFEIIICEQAPELTSVGAGITLWPNALISLRNIDKKLENNVIESGFPYFGGSIKTNNGNELINQNLAELFTKMNSTAIGIHRAELIKCLKLSLNTNQIHVNKKCISISQTSESVTAHFLDDSSISADILIGADGINSVIRENVFPNIKKRYSGYIAWRGIAKVSTKFRKDIINNLGESWGKGKRFGFVMISEELVYWFSTENRAEKDEKPTNAKQHLIQTFSNWHYPIPEIVEVTNDEDILYNAIYDMKSVRGWFKDRILLIGDAIHSTTPNMGQGGCISIEDAYILAELLSSLPFKERNSITNLNQIFKQFENLRYAKTSMIQKNSWRVGKVGQWSNSLFTLLRNTIIRLTPNYFFQRQINKVIKPP